MLWLPWFFCFFANDPITSSGPQTHGIMVSSPHGHPMAIHGPAQVVLCHGLFPPGRRLLRAALYCRGPVTFSGRGRPALSRVKTMAQFRCQWGVGAVQWGGLAWIYGKKPGKRWGIVSVYERFEARSWNGLPNLCLLMIDVW